MNIIYANKSNKPLETLVKLERGILYKIYVEFTNIDINQYICINDKYNIKSSMIFIPGKVNKVINITSIFSIKNLYIIGYGYLYNIAIKKLSYYHTEKKHTGKYSREWLLTDEPSRIKSCFDILVDELPYIPNIIDDVAFLSKNKPFEGGAATNIYKLMLYFKRGICIYYNYDKKIPIFPNEIRKYDPFNTQRIICLNSSNIWTNIVALFFKPSKIFVKDYSIYNIALTYSPNIILLLQGLKTIKYTDIENISEKYIDKQLLSIIPKFKYIITNSKMTHDLITKIYPSTISKLFLCNTSNIPELYYSPPKSPKTIDVLYVEKYNKNTTNIEHLINLATKIVSRFSGIQLLQILAQTKILIIPSLFDSSPNILYEALLCNCRVIISPFVGHDPLPNIYVCNTLFAKEWQIVINKLLQ